MRVIIAGGRDYQFTQEDIAFLDSIQPEIDTVISGGARGADACGEQWAHSRSIPIEIYEAEWSKYGKAAGPMRNLTMALSADALVAFPGGRGTDHIVLTADSKNLKVWDRRKELT